MVEFDQCICSSSHPQFYRACLSYSHTLKPTTASTLLLLAPVLILYGLILKVAVRHHRAAIRPLQLGTFVSAWPGPGGIAGHMVAQLAGNYK